MYAAPNTIERQKMSRILRHLALGSTVLAMPAGAAMAQSSAPYQHVLLISVDGMHGIDLQNWVNNPAHANSTLTKLSHRGVTYQEAYTTAPSDSFPGMIAQVTGATPFSADIFYDDSFDRTVYPAGSNCQSATGVGAETNLSEALDKDSSQLNAGGKLGQPRTQIDVTKLPLRPDATGCMPVYPHQFLKVNTVFEVVKSAGMRTAWSDKHPAYEILNGPSGKGIDDLYTPEINSNNVLGGGGDNTQSFNAVSAYDQNKVDAIVHEIDGYDSVGQHYVGIPAIFGMNFQSVSVGQKLASSGPTDPPGLKGGYLDANATPGNALTQELTYVDQAIGQMVAELKKVGHYGDTLIIISAKHGQSPIDPSLRTTRDDGQFFPQTLGLGFYISDDVLLLWLQPNLQKADKAAALAYLNSVAAAANLQVVNTGEQYRGTFKSPLTDPRTPDFIGLPYHGTIYTTGSKLAEHGGFADDDRHVAMLVSGTGVPHGVQETATVMTTQIAPTILTALGLDPNALQGVRIEHTAVLPRAFK
jgi:hypothetical protein